MKKFKFKVVKVSENGSKFEHDITIIAEDKWKASSKLDEMYPKMEYKHDFIECVS